MSKELKEVIAQLEVARKHFLAYKIPIRAQILDETIDKLRTLAKPVQYVVQIVKKDVDGLYMSKLNGVIIYHSFQLEEVRPQSIFRLNKMSEAFSLPPITIEQITFVEV